MAKANKEERAQRTLPGSILVLVLVILVIASLLLIFTMNQLASYLQQRTTEKNAKITDIFAKSALDVVTKQIVNTPLDSLDDGVYRLRDLGICGADFEQKDKRCDDTSAVFVKVLKHVYLYRLNHDQTIQVNNNTPVVEIMLTPNSEDTLHDRILVNAYSKNSMAPIGVCVISYRESGVSSITCLPDSNVGGVVLPVDAEHTDYGRFRVRIVFKTSTPDYIRIKALTSNLDESVNISVTSKNYRDFQEAQEVIMIAAVSSANTSENKVKTKLIRAILMSRMMPEVFDWVLFNGSGGSIQK